MYFARRGQNSSGIEERAANEFRVATLRRGRYAQRLQLFDAWIAFGGAGSAGRDPVGEQVIVGGQDLDLESAAMGQSQRRLEKHETARRFRFVDAAAEGLPGQNEMIVGRSIAAQR